MSDEGVHEIQLNGKQLVFMFMAVTVVAVVIFLCGVMVGRGVRAPRAADQADTATESNVDPTAAIQPSSPSAPISSDPSPSAAPAPVPTQEKLTYADRLGTTTQPPETLKEPVTPASVVSQPAPEPAPVTPAVRAAKSSSNERATKSSTTERATKSSTNERATKTSTNEPSGGGYVVQVAAVKARDEADTIARKLASKGFPSFVTTPGPGAAGVYRVRVGKYTDRREAESVARRLEKEEQFKPWITR